MIEVSIAFTDLYGILNPDHQPGDEATDNLEVDVDVHGDQPEKKSAHYWVATILFWGVATFLVVTGVYFLVTGDIGQFIGFLVYAALYVAAGLKPKWLQRVASFGRSSNQR